jgi:homoserine dehydrogenase
MTEPLRIGLAGLGTVGIGIVRILQEQADDLTRQCGCKLQLVAVSARDRNRDRGLKIADALWVESPLDLVDRDDVDVIVEVIGGAKGVAADLVEAALRKGKDVITANKALLSTHGLELARLAERHTAKLMYEAAVAGGLPIIKTLREALAANRITRLMGIMNGSTNAILTMIAHDGTSYPDAIAEAKSRGWLEADPSLDLDGWDAAHKLSLLMTLAFGQWCPLSGLTVRGIGGVTQPHLELAAQAGGTIKLIGRAETTEHGVWGGVMPCFVPHSSPFYNIWGSLNGILASGDRVGDIFVTGRGAGEGPTASAVMSDLIDLARGNGNGPVFARPAADMPLSELLVGLSEEGKALLILENSRAPLSPAQIMPHLATLDLQPQLIIEHEGVCGLVLPPMPQPRQFNYGATMQLDMPDLVATLYPFIPG